MTDYVDHAHYAHQDHQDHHPDADSSGTPPRLVVFVSGSGSNLQAILDAISEGKLNAEVVLVASNRKEAYGLVRAQEAGIETLYFPKKPYSEAGKYREEYDRDLALKVKEYRPNLVVLAGWMHIFSKAFLEHFPNRVINLHPALPGMFAGTHAIERAFEAFQRGEITHSGCMVHYAIPEVDAGPVIITSEVAIKPDDTLERFEDRVHEHEHDIIVEAIRLALTQS
jgi:formyltetrahydrofolate-dependent phosphoribosylglycinamide formyltransferase